MTKKFLKRLWEALRKNATVTALEVLDENGQLHAGTIYTQFQHKIIHLFGAFLPESGKMGVMPFAIWKSIEMAGPEVKVIDFEGSMLESVEFFPQF